MLIVRRAEDVGHFRNEFAGFEYDYLNWEHLKETA